MSRGVGLTLAERSGGRVPTSHAPGPVADPAARAQERVRPVVTRHCWVSGLPDRPGGWPGLLVEWRQETGSGQWFGRVMYVVDDNGRGVLIETWVVAGHLSPA